MAGEKNFIVKNGLSVGTNDVLDGSGDLTSAAFGTAANEAIDDRVNSLIVAGSGITSTYDDAAGTLTLTGNVGDITGVNAGAGLTGTASSGDATLNIGAGTGITVNADTIQVTQSVIDGYADARVQAALIDEDNFSSDSATRIPSQQSTKAYIATQIATKDNTDEMTEGSSNLYHTTARARASVSAGGDLTYNSTTGVMSFTNDAGDISSVVAGAGLTGGATTGDATLNIGAGTGISVATDAISVNMGAFTSDNLGEGSTNVYHTSERVQDVTGAQLATNGSHTGLTATYDDAGDGAVDLAVSTEFIADTVGAMVTSNVESGLSVVYQDADNTLDFTVATLNQDTTGLAGTATALASSRTISGVGFDGTANITLNTGGITESGNLYYTNERVDDRVGALVVGGTNITATYNDAAGTLTIDGNAADITGVIAGDGLTGGATSGDATLNLDASVAGDGLGHSSGVLSVTVDDSSIETNSDTLRVKATGITNAMLAGSIANAKLSNSSVTINSQAVALGAAVTLNTSHVGESGNLYYTDERVDDRVNTLITDGANITSTYDDSAGTLTIATDALDQEQVDDRMNAVITAGTNITKTYNDAAGTLTITGSTDGEIRALHSAVSNGIGGLAYNASTGAYTYDGPTASDVRAQLSAGTGVGFSGGAISIGQAVATSSNVTFADMVLSGNLTVNGTTSTVSSTNTTMTDSLIELGNGTTGSPSNDAGIVIERGSESNVFMGWDDSATGFVFGTTTATGASTGAISVTPSAVSTGALSITNASNSGGTARNMYQSTSSPSSGDGAVGDMWILYS